MSGVVDLDTEAHMHMRRGGERAHGREEGGGTRRSVVSSMYLCVRMYVYSARVQRALACTCIYVLRMCMCIYAYVCMYVHVYVRVYMRVYACIAHPCAEDNYMRVCVCMCVCMCLVRKLAHVCVYSRM